MLITQMKPVTSVFCINCIIFGIDMHIRITFFKIILQLLLYDNSIWKFVECKGYRL